MNYVKIYTDLVNKGLERGLNKRNLDYYVESHHIFPKCLNGIDGKINRVLLTAREHYIAHKILVKMYPEQPGLILAVYRLIKDSKDRLISSRDYAKFKAAYSEYRRIEWSGDKHPTRGKKSWNSGIKLPDKMIENIRKGSLGIRKPGTGDKLRGRKRSIETISKMASTHKGMKRSNTACKNIRQAQRTKPHWKFEDELYSLWIKNDKIHFNKFRKIAVDNGYPDVDYQGMVKSWKRTEEI